MNSQKHTFSQSTVFPMLFIMALWLVFYFNAACELHLQDYGIRPRELGGLTGIISAVFLHGDLSHLFSNTIPILVLGTLLFYYYCEVAFKVFFFSVLAGDLLVWLLARGGTTHIGASGIIYALAGFLFFSGILRKNKTLFGVSLLITFLYGTIVWGVLPVEFLKAIHYQVTQVNISWEGHLFGFLSGITLAYIYRNKGTQAPVYSWEVNNDQDIDESDPYWMVDPDETPETSKEDVLKNTSDNPYTVNYTFIPKEDKKE